MGIPLIPTNDVHYIYENEQKQQQHILKAHTKGKVANSNYQQFLKSHYEMNLSFSKEELEDAEILAKRCTANWIKTIQNIAGTGENAAPLSMIYRYRDDEAVKKVYFSTGEFRLGTYYQQIMRKRGWRIEDIPIREDNERYLDMAKSLRGTVYDILPDPYYVIQTNEDMPIYRKNSKQVMSVQFSHDEANAFGWDIIDTRKITSYPTKKNA